jgi:DNA-directed RNA polymerase subunit RPC12/RpoP
LENEAFSLNSCDSKEENSDICSPYVEKLFITGVLSQFLIPKIGILRARLLSLLLLGFGYISLLYGFLGQHSPIFLFSLPLIICGFALMKLRGYYMFRICKNCGKELAYVMTRKPEIKGDYPEETITSYYRCRYCDHEHVEVEIVVRGYDSP